MVFTVVGDVVRPGYAEVELGTPVREVIHRVGAASDRGAKAVFSGVSNGVLTAQHLDAPATYEHLRAAGSGLGSAGFVVYDDTADMVAVARMFARFLHVESCGQCGACKMHSGAISEALVRLEQHGDDDVEDIGARLRMVTDQNRCYVPVELQAVVASILREFPEDFVAHLDGRPPATRMYRLPKRVTVGRDAASAGPADERADQDTAAIGQVGQHLAPGGGGPARVLVEGDRGVGHLHRGDDEVAGHEGFGPPAAQAHREVTRPVAGASSSVTPAATLAGGSTGSITPARRSACRSRSSSADRPSSVDENT